jgi:hypothetical protein
LVRAINQAHRAAAFHHLLGLVSLLENRFFINLYHIKIDPAMAATLHACSHASLFLGSCSMLGNLDIMSHTAFPILAGKDSG